ncbi:hypothetical protein [Rhizobium grahamii]|uniref:Transmembrane protein n=2 Tax=Rhizobium grahamii TaxID=1120045 RepID=A0A370KFA5_9HYPH|nr:hypothetical protein [Rhizobium grahamii]EPE96201.1 putative transmembrane protein [Rhizobium grahamii CCGE 502]RDJ03013.1 hypothetical protein B5K06_31520 [Rhizobium grahamii]
MAIYATFMPDFSGVGSPWTEGRDMDFLNRFVDQPMLQGASRVLQIWHERSHRPPDELSPLWNLLVIAGLFMSACWYLPGSAGLLAAGTLVMLSFPHAWKLLKGPMRRDYDARAYRAMAALAIKKRETEWTVRVLVLMISACLPMLARGGDLAGELFVIGAGLWFVLTAPANAYLAAAEPPRPRDGDSVFSPRRVMASA